MKNAIIPADKKAKTDAHKSLPAGEGDRSGADLWRQRDCGGGGSHTDALSRLYNKKQKP